MSDPTREESPSSARARSLPARGLACGALVCAALLGAPAEARAATCASGASGAEALTTCFDGDELWLHAGRGPFLSVGPGATVPKLRAGFGLSLSGLGWPVRVDGRPLVDFAVNGAFMGVFGITDRLELSMVAPLTIFQQGEGIGALAPTSPLGGKNEITRSVLRDMRFAVSFAALARPRVGKDEGLGLVLRWEFSAPTGDERAFAGAGTAVFAPSVALSWRGGPVEVGAELGARIRPEREVAGRVFGSQARAAVGVAVDVVPDRILTLGVEAFALGTLAAQKDAAGADAPPLVASEWMGTVTSAPVLAGDLSFFAHGGTALPVTGSLGPYTPDFRFGVGVRYAPTGQDTDGDGIPDRDDKCPKEKEDRDGFQDDDGCPDPDNDGDGIPDVRDKCRDEPETVDGFQDDDGCPDDDDDKDGVPDAEDKCRNQAEDKDGIADEDGCPEVDFDGDGIPDEKDLCPRTKEDLDGYKDDDGCPDPDNDGDGILDEADLCPNKAEDRDDFEDDDGCPDPDNDKDGVPDKVDRCKLEPETIDGKDDDDGCPEAGARSLVSMDGDKLVLPGKASFAPGKSEIPAALGAELKMGAQLVRGLGTLDFVIIEVAPERANDKKAFALADARALAVKAAFVAAGIPETVISAAVGEATKGSRSLLSISAKAVKPRKKKK